MPKHGGIPDPIRRRQAAKLRAQGLTFRQIATRLGISKEAAYRLVNPRGHQPCPPSEARCKDCQAVIRPGLLAYKANRDAFCLACLAKHPEASFAERLKAYRLAAGLTRAELAERSGVGLTNIAHYEIHDSADPGWSKVCRLADVLGMGLLGLPMLELRRFLDWIAEQAVNKGFETLEYLSQVAGWREGENEQSE